MASEKVGVEGARMVMLYAYIGTTPYLTKWDLRDNYKSRLMVLIWDLILLYRLLSRQSSR